MCIDELSIAGKGIKLWIPQQEVEAEALSQLYKVASLPWVYKHVAIMPDVHAGKGCTVGSVIAMKDAVSPSCVGVDIGCGMGAIKTNLTANDLPEDLKKLRLMIEDLIPVGFNKHSTPALKKSQQTLFNEFKGLHHKVHSMEEDVLKQVGTLGGGNHFIELCLDTDNNVWMMLHSGSRRIGKELAEIHIEKAKRLAHNQNIVDRDLAVFLAGTTEMADYRRDLYWAQRYAFLNREIMFDLYKKTMLSFFPHAKFGDAIMCHHNYVAEEIHFGEEVFVTRKGAISAEKGKMGIIPGSMATNSFIVEGLGNPDSFNSASHGAGRKMSRGAAKRAFTEQDIQTQLGNVECRRDSGIIDELPLAYKDIKSVMNNQKDLVKIVTELRQVLCIKG
jgi:tRNA-splicing ligase RtcB (3'-phosphate/5'-hydroxy nucleic acid ligase)